MSMEFGLNFQSEDKFIHLKNFKDFNIIELPSKTGNRKWIIKMEKVGKGENTSCNLLILFTPNSDDKLNPYEIASLAKILQEKKAEMKIN